MKVLAELPGRIWMHQVGIVVTEHKRSPDVEFINSNVVLHEYRVVIDGLTHLPQRATVRVLHRTV